MIASITVDIMNGIKRRFEGEDALSSKKPKWATKNFHGGDWRQKLVSIVKGQYNVELDHNVSGMIFEFSSGRRDACCFCSTKTDELIGIIMMRIDNGKIGFHCEQCNP